MNKIVFVFIIIFTTSCQFFQNEKSATQLTESGELNTINDKIDKDEKNPNLYFERGKIYRKLKQDSLALIDFKRCTQLDSTKAIYYSAVGEVLFDHKDISGSVPWFEKAIALNPNDEKAHLKMAKLFIYISEYTKAFIEINTVLKTNVYNAEAYFLKGICYTMMSDTSKAISSLQTAVQTDPLYAEAHLQLGVLYEAQKNPLALKYYENAFKADSTNMEYMYAQAMYWQNKNEYEAAKKILKKIVTKDMSYPKSYYNLGWIYLQQDSTEKAIRQFDIAIENKPDYADAYFNRGLCYEILSNFDKAMEDYEYAITFAPDNSKFQESLRLIKQKTK